MAVKEATKATDAVATTHLKDDVLALAEKIQQAMSVDKDTGIATVAEDIYDANLPENLTPEIVKDVKNYDTTFVAAGAFAFGQLAVEAMKSNKNLDRATGEIRLGHKDSVSYGLDRSKTFANHLAGEGQTIEKFGVMNVAVEMRAGKNAGELKKARGLIAELATRAFKG